MREEAAKDGANTAIWVEYGHTTGWWYKRSTYALGTADMAGPSDVPCPCCAEPVKRAAVVRRCCGRNLEPPPSVATPYECPVQPPSTVGA